MKIRLILTLLTAAALSLGVSCKGKGPTKQERIDAFNEAGWEGMAEGNCAEALQEFADAVALDSNNVEGNIGVGWSLILMNSTNLDRISNALGKGTADNVWQQDAWAVIESPENLVENRAEYIKKYDSMVWDAEWLAGELDLEMQSLPEAWQSATDPAAIQAILDEINR